MTKHITLGEALAAADDGALIEDGDGNRFRFDEEFGEFEDSRNITKSNRSMARRIGSGDLLMINILKRLIGMPTIVVVYLITSFSIGLYMLTAAPAVWILTGNHRMDDVCELVENINKTVVSWFIK